MVVSGGRSPDGSEDIFEQEARVAVELAVNADADALLEKFREERGQNDRAAEGPRATFSALAMADVAVRAALGTGAGIRVVGAGAGLEGGIGASLRWSS